MFVYDGFYLNIFKKIKKERRKKED